MKFQYHFAQFSHFHSLFEAKRGQVAGPRSHGRDWQSQYTLLCVYPHTISDVLGYRGYHNNGLISEYQKSFCAKCTHWLQSLI